MSSQGNRKQLTKDADLISNLPDAVLCLILTYLPTKSVVKTSTLSKRWKYLWANVPALDFTEMTSTGDRGLSSEQMAHFKRFVDRVLLHNYASCVERLRLDLVDCHPIYVNSWLIAATRRRIQELNISIGPLMLARLPQKFLCSKCLVILKLKGVILIYTGASESFFLPKLETIHLQCLEFPDDEFMKKLSSSCPVLRELRIVNCTGITSTLYVESLTLKSLEIRDSIAKLKQQRIIIKAPNLMWFCLSDFQSLYDVIGDMDSLIEAKISMNIIALNVDDIDHGRRLLRKVSGVKTLHLGQDDNLLRGSLPIFRNLTFLKCEASELTCELLRCAPELKFLVLHQFGPDTVFKPQLAPEQLSCLESVEVRCFSGVEFKMDVVAYFLKAASALKEMKINLECNSMVDEIEVYQMLLDLPRSSAICGVKVV